MKIAPRFIGALTLSVLIAISITACGSGDGNGDGTENYSVVIEETVSGNYRYTEIELISPGGGSIQPKSINDNGDIAGLVIHSAPSSSSCGCGMPILKGFLYSGGIYTEIIPPGWIYAFATDINNNKDIVGIDHDPIISKKGFLYSDGRYTELLPPGWEYVRGIFAINDNGDVVGTGSVSDYYYNGQPAYSTKGFLYSDGIYTEIIPPGWNRSSARDINNKGDIVGIGDNKGFLYSAGEYIEINPPGFDYVGNISINNNGDIAGWGFDSTDTRKGFLYSKGEYTEINNPVEQCAYNVSINDRGEVVGACVGARFIYSDGQYTEIIPPEWSFASDISINNKGDIAGWGMDAGKSKFFIATPDT